jgi:hypothetical protein
MNAASLDTRWTLSGYSSNNTITHYTDWNSISSDGDLVYFWELVDYRFLNSASTYATEKSYVTYHEGDCVKFRYRSYQTHLYAKFMAEGDIVETTIPDSSWVYPPPDTPQRRGLGSVCTLTKHLRQ